jgi:hypothetical protein
MELSNLHNEQKNTYIAVSLKPNENNYQLTALQKIVTMNHGK